MNNQYDRNSGDLIPVEGKLGLYRDPNNLAIVNKIMWSMNLTLQEENLYKRRKKKLKILMKKCHH